MRADLDFYSFLAPYRCVLIGLVVAAILGRELDQQNRALMCLKNRWDVCKKPFSRL